MLAKVTKKRSGDGAFVIRKREVIVNENQVTSFEFESLRVIYN